MALKPFMIFMLGKSQYGFIKPSSVKKFFGEYMVPVGTHLKLDPDDEYSLGVLFRDGKVLMDGSKLAEGFEFEKMEKEEYHRLLYTAEFLGKDPTTPS